MNATTLAVPLDDAVPDTPQAKSRSGLKLAAAAGAIAISIAAWHFIQLAMYTEETDNSYITGRIHQISANISGPLLQVAVEDNEVVKAGQLLAKVDPREFEIMEKKAAAQLKLTGALKLQTTAKAAEARSAAAQAQAVITGAEADIKGAEARLAFAKITLSRNENLFTSASQSVPQSAVDQSRSDLEAAEAQLAAARARLDAARAGEEAAAAAIQAAEAELGAVDAGIAMQQSAADEAHRQMAYTGITAPSAGRIGAKNAEAGNRVQTGQTLFALVESDCWIIANFKETQLAKMAAGQPVDIAIDALGGRHFKGSVQSIAPATGAQFALLPPDNATGNFTKVVQRVPVKITFDADSIRGFEDQIRPGLSTIVRVTTR